MKFKQPINFNKLGLFLILLFFGLLSVSVTHAETYNFVAKWGSGGSGNGQFSNPMGVAVDSSGNVYVVDQLNHRIQKFDGSGEFITKWGSWGSEDGQFSDPRGVAVDPFGNVYVADMNNNRIQKFDNSGIFIVKWDSVSPHDVAVDSSGNVYVDCGDRIQKFDSSGTFIAEWCSGGSCGQLSSYGFAVDSSGNVYVADDSCRIRKFDSNGIFITEWGSWGSGNGQFTFPTDVAVDSSGNVYVADTDNHRIQKFDSSGAFITKWGSEGSGDGQFSDPQGIAVDFSDNVYVADTYNGRIQKFALGNIIPTIIWSNPDDIIYGTPLSSTQLNADATDPLTGESVSGTFTYTLANGTSIDLGTILSVGKQTLHVDFTSTDTAKYNLASKDVTINVLKASPTITWNNSEDIVQGTALSSTQLNAISSVPGTFVYYPPSETILSEGIYTLHVNFIPTDTANYNTASKDVKINVITPVQKIRQMNTNVRSLVNSGSLSPKQGDTLIRRLNAAIKAINANRAKNAIRKLNAFIIHVEIYIQSGILAQTQGQSLVDAANTVIYVL